MIDRISDDTGGWMNLCKILLPQSSPQRVALARRVKKHRRSSENFSYSLLPLAECVVPDAYQKRIRFQTFQSFNRFTPFKALRLFKVQEFNGNSGRSSRSNRSTASLRSKRLTRDNSNCNRSRRFRLPALRRVARCVRIGRVSHAKRTAGKRVRKGNQGSVEIGRGCRGCR
jgi:hypothetical protein